MDVNAPIPLESQYKHNAARHRQIFLCKSHNMKPSKAGISKDGRGATKTHQGGITESVCTKYVQTTLFVKL